MSNQYRLPEIDGQDMACGGGFDQITAMTFSCVEEVIGIARAARAAEVPVVISFVAKQNGRLLSGETLEEAVKKVDAATGTAPAYYMINCSHPSEFEPALNSGDWTQRLGGMETLSLCELGHLKDGDPEELGAQTANLARRFPHIHVWGGCCGTDGRHIGQITRQVRAVRQAMAAE